MNELSFVTFYFLMLQSPILSIFLIYICLYIQCRLASFFAPFFFNFAFEYSRNKQTVASSLAKHCSQANNALFTPCRHFLYGLPLYSDCRCFLYLCRYLYILRIIKEIEQRLRLWTSKKNSLPWRNGSDCNFGFCLHLRELFDELAITFNFFINYIWTQLDSLLVSI